MRNLYREYIFRPIEGIWKDVATNGGVLADVLNEYSLVIDDRAEFCRLNDYERNLQFWYRAYNGAKITLTIYRIEPVK